MKFSKLIFYIASIILLNEANAQVGEWVWIHGSSTPSSPGNFGVQGVSNPANDPSGTFEPVRWTDQTGNFWFFGGMRLNPGFGELADMWKYNPGINEWTWMKGNNLNDDPGNYGTKGVPDPANLPPARGFGAASWVDNQGNFWMYGGYGPTGPGYRDDLWKYEIATNNWTWINGSSSTNQQAVYGTIGVSSPANTPGERAECGAAWTDNNGDLWLFGGRSGFGGCSDMWKYNIASNEWTWMKGPQGPGIPGMYGTRGVEAPVNNPGGRYVYASWKDSQGNFWLFGGLDNGYEMNDLWRFNPVTNNWAWMSGDNFGLSPGLFETHCDAAASRHPSARTLTTSCWIDQHDNLWLFSGGSGQTAVIAKNDLWKYCPATDEWAWISGDSIDNTAGNWGTIGVSSPSNVPDGRMGAVSWADSNGNFYLFGGNGPGAIYPYNDLWKFTADTSCGSCFVTAAMAELQSPEFLRVFPNPAANKIIIHLNTPHAEIRLRVTDLRGMAVLDEGTISAGTERYELDVSGCSPGLYFLDWTSPGYTGRKKILVSR